ncbi:hypothetical protein ACLESD_23040 [Pyxidicoccus sp. 3LFB2]
MAAALAGVLFHPVSALAGTRAAPTTTDTGQVWDLVTEFMFNNGPALQFGTAGAQIQNDFLEPAPTNKFYYVKQQDTAIWEKYGIYSSVIALERDTSAPAGSPENSYDAVPYGSLTYPRTWTVGKETTFNTTIKYFNRNTCRYTAPASWVKWAHGRHFLRFQGPINVGGSLGTIDVVIIDRYHYLSDDSRTAEYHNPREAERFWYARGRGWIRWDYFTDRTVGKWNRSDTPGLLNPGVAPEVKTVWFKNNAPQYDGKTPTRVCPNGVN